MARKIEGNVEIKEIFFDESLYPRSSYNWQTAYDYSQSMRTGVKFPQIVLALFDGKKYLVDGKHRIEACKLLKVKKIPAIVYTGWNKEKIFKEAVKSNIAHGRGLTPFDKRNIALRLMEMNSSQKEISTLIQVPLDKLERFVNKRLVNTLTGEEMTLEQTEQNSREIGQAILKSSLKHFAGKTISEEELAEIEDVQKNFYMGSQFSLLDNVVKILEGGLLDKNNPKVMKLIDKIKTLLNEGE